MRNIIILQYIELSRIHDQRDKDGSDIETNNSLENTIKSKRIDSIKLASENEIYKLHANYKGRLRVELSFEQLDSVKDGHTYNVLPTTYAEYLKQSPDITLNQKKIIFGYLYAARELAMDKGTSDEKHTTFRIYKGIINNYLSMGPIDTLPDDNPEHTLELAEQVNKYLPAIIDSSNSENYHKILAIIIRHLKDLHQIHDEREKAITAKIADNSNAPLIKELDIELLRLETENELYNLHANFLGRLNAELTPEEVDSVKDVRLTACIKSLLMNI